MHTCSQSCQNRSKGQVLECLAPTLKSDPGDTDYSTALNYTVVVDNASGPDITNSALQLILYPDPIFLGIEETDTIHPINDNSTAIRIRVRITTNTEDVHCTITHVGSVYMYLCKQIPNSFRFKKFIIN